jgi:hypothetical protein
MYGPGGAQAINAAMAASVAMPAPSLFLVLVR